MADSEFEARVTRYKVARLRLGQMLLPVAVLTTVAARRFPNVLTVLVALGMQVVCLAFFLTGGTRFGWQRLVFERGGMTVGSTDARIERNRVHRWTIVGGVARLYGLEHSYKLGARTGNEEALSAFLSSRFGPPLNLRRRGSFRARMIALAVGVMGLIGAAMAIGIGIDWLAIVGPLAFIFGVATFGALSQRTT
jgi:hypothetical protein